MNTRTMLTALLAAGVAGTSLAGQEPAAAPQTEMQKWIATTDAQWQEAFKKGVTDMHETELNKAKLQYLNLLEGALDKASKANDLKGAVALRDEQKRFGDTQHFPEQDDAAEAAAVKQVRAAIRAQLARANADRDARAKALHAKYDQFLAQTQTQLTQAKRLDDALAVQAKREEVKGAWIDGVAPPATGTEQPASKKQPVTTPSITGGGVTPLAGTAMNPAAAKKEKPFVNGLGMQFVPVRNTGVLFSTWLTRVQDYGVFAAKSAAKAPTPAYEQTPAHPVVLVNWDDAQNFCAWLTKHEIAEGKLPKEMKYRLPTDLEWSAAVGLGHEVGKTPAERSGKIKNVYPWGKTWPPPTACGNYSGDLSTDTFEYTSPVGSFRPNEFGLYDMGGNVWEWCDDWFDSRESSRILRGCSWKKNGPGMGNSGLLSSFRFSYPPEYRFDNFGFRVVLDLAAGKK